MLGRWPMRALCATAVIAASCALIGIVMVFGAAPAVAQATPAAISDAQDVNGVAGVVAEIVQCKRDSGVLSIRMRLRNTGDDQVNVSLIHLGNYDQYYFTAGSKKYFVLRDSEKTPLATQINASDSSVVVTIAKGGSYVWYAKYQRRRTTKKRSIITRR